MTPSTDPTGDRAARSDARCGYPAPTGSTERTAPGQPRAPTRRNTEVVTPDKMAPGHGGRTDRNPFEG
jgi:hypothetical protein